MPSPMSVFRSCMLWFYKRKGKEKNGARYMHARQPWAEAVREKSCGICSQGGAARFLGSNATANCQKHRQCQERWSRLFSHWVGKSTFIHLFPRMQNEKSCQNSFPPKLPALHAKRCVSANIDIFKGVFHAVVLNLQCISLGGGWEILFI